MAEEHSLELEHAAIELSPSYVQDHSDRANLAISNNVQFTVVGPHGARLVHVAQTVAVESSLNIENAKILSLSMVENVAAASREGPKCATRTLVQSMVAGHLGLLLDHAADLVEEECNIAEEPVVIHHHPLVEKAAVAHHTNQMRVIFIHAQSTVVGRTGVHLDLAAKAVDVECDFEAEFATIHVNPVVEKPALDHRMNLRPVTYAYAQ